MAAEPDATSISNEQAQHLQKQCDEPHDAAAASEPSVEPHRVFAGDGAAFDAIVQSTLPGAVLVVRYTAGWYVCMNMEHLIIIQLIFAIVS